MKNNIMIIVIVTVVAIGVIAAVIIAGFVKDSENSNVSIPDWGGSSGFSESVDDSSSSISSSEGSTSSSTESSVASSTESSVASSTESSVISSAPQSTSSSSSSEPTSSSGEELTLADSVIATANSLIGTPFVLGGQSPKGFDSSGFIYYVLRENGFQDCPRYISGQAEMGRQLAYDELKEGDLVLFYNDHSATPEFGGIYIGNGEMIAALTPSNREHGVMKADITSLYYQKRFYCGVSLS